MNNNFFDQHVFCCINERPEGHEKGCCAAKKSIILRAYMKKKTKELITENQVSFAGTDCHNMNHAELYEKCQTTKAWHDLVNSGKLLNATL